MEQVPFQNYNFKYNETHINCRIDMQRITPRGLLKCILKASKTEHILKEFKLMITVCVFFLSNLSNVTLYSFFFFFLTCLPMGCLLSNCRKGRPAHLNLCSFAFRRIISATLSSVSKSKMLLRGCRSRLISRQIFRRQLCLLWP